MDWSLANLWPYFVAVVSLVASAAATIHVVLHKREPRAAVGWIALVWLSPVIGCVLYFALGVNRIRRKAVSLGLQDRWHHPRYTPPVEQDLAEQQAFIAQSPTLASFGTLVSPINRAFRCPG